MTARAGKVEGLSRLRSEASARRADWSVEAFGAAAQGTDAPWRNNEVIL
jgi:hypothetical protein